MNESRMDEMYKNRLQEYAQKSSIPIPIYKTVNEGALHAPQFRATVFVDGTHYTSPTTFPKIKQAHKDVARVAFQAILQKPKEHLFPFLFKDTYLCKSIMVEYAVKMKLEKPTFVTKEAQGLCAVFVSDLVLNGVNYTGQRAKSKKEAEQLAARAAIISILDSESKLVMSEIIKSKEKLYLLLHDAGVNQEVAGGNVAESSDLELALNKRKDPTAPEAMGTASSNVAESSDLELAFNKRKELAAPEAMATAGGNVAESSDLELALNKRKEPAAPEAMATASSFNAGSGALAQPFHEFKKPKVETPSEVLPFPITFVPPGHIPKVEFVACSTSGKKKNRKKKKKNKEEEIVRGDTQIADSVMPLVEAPPCSAVQCAGASV